MSKITSPKTNRKIKVGGDTFNNLLKDEKYKDKLLKLVKNKKTAHKVKSSSPKRRIISPKLHKSPMMSPRNLHKSPMMSPRNLHKSPMMSPRNLHKSPMMSPRKHEKPVIDMKKRSPILSQRNLLEYDEPMINMSVRRRKTPSPKRHRSPILSQRKSSQHDESNVSMRRRETPLPKKLNADMSMRKSINSPEILPKRKIIAVENQNIIPRPISGTHNFAEKITNDDGEKAYIIHPKRNNSFKNTYDF